MTEPLLGGVPFAYPRSRGRPVRPCPCGCKTLGFCESHKARLAVVREELNAEGAARKKNPKYSIRGARNSAEVRRRSWKTDWDTDLDDQEADVA